MAMASFVSFVLFGLAALVCFVSLIGCGAALVLFATQLEDINLKIWTLVLVGFPYAILGTVLLCFLFRRTTRLRRKLHKIPKDHIAIRDGELPQNVRSYINAEYLRAAAIAYTSQPTKAENSGWATSGSQNEPIYMRKSLLDSIQRIDSYARLVLPNLPQLKPHSRIIEHLRTLGYTLPELVAPIRIYDAAIDRARYTSGEPSLSEYQRAMEAINLILQLCEEYRIDRPLPSETQSSRGSFKTAQSGSS